LAAGEQSHNLIKTICHWELTIFGWIQMVIQMYERVESEIQEMCVLLPMLKGSYCVETGTRKKPTHLQENADAAYISSHGTLEVSSTQRK
jgi:hypothetical protein